MADTRCAGCGKIIDPNTPVVTVTTAKTSQHEKKVWGEMHEPCFESAIDSPEVTLKQIRKLGKVKVVKPSKKAKNVTAA